MAPDELYETDHFYACRTCGIVHFNSSKLLYPIFSTDSEFARISAFIRTELSSWKSEVYEDDGFPQHICKGCVQVFQTMYSFKELIKKTKEDFVHYYSLQQSNTINIKTEVKEEDEEREHFIYVDDLSDEYDDTIPLEVPHVSIKEELIGEAAIPDEINTSGISEVSSEQLTSFTPEEAHEIVQNQQESLLNTAPTVVHNTTDEEQKLPEKGCSRNSVQADISQTKRKFTDQRFKIKNYYCRLCRKKFSNLNIAQYKYHLRWHKINRKRIKCTRCGFNCNFRTTLKEHIRAKHTKLRCSLCNKLLPQQRMESHMVKYHQNDDGEKASQVNVSFAKEIQKDIEEQQTANSDMREQLADTHLNVNNSRFDIQCAQCSQASFRSITELEQHVREHHSFFTTLTPPLTSPTTDVSLTIECNKTYSYTDQFYYNSDDEENQMHRIETVDQYTCANCPAQYTTVEDLCEHSKTHYEKLKFTCHLCSKSFKFKFSLNRHLKKHTN